jgi:UDP-N-acetylmuramoyl-tripeptide--D-alanyl-D-alanine ligase
VFIADTTKAPLYSINLSIKMMEEFSAPRKRIVIGNISDFAGNPRAKYRDVYRAARLIADQVIFVGENSHRSKATAEEIAMQKFVEKRTVKEGASFVRQTAIAGEIILLKSSARLHLERILLSFETEVHCWKQKCRKGVQCVECGRYLPQKRKRSRAG